MVATPAAASLAAPRVCLIDASIYIYRAWHDVPHGTCDPEGRQANAISGFADMLTRLLIDERPVHVACAFDTCGREGTRNAIHPGYKRSRAPRPASLGEQLDRCMTLCRALGVNALGSTHVEADDIIGQLARLARHDGHHVTIVSGDKDLIQHVASGDLYRDFARQPPRDAKALERRLGVRPSQIPDWLALSGDASDDIPGVPGVGRATAARLLRKWGSLELLFANLDKVARMRFRGAPGVAAQLATHHDTVWFARRLTGSIEDASLPGSLTTLRRRHVAEPLLRAALRDVGVAAPLAATRATALAAIPTHASAGASPSEPESAP